MQNYNYNNCRNLSSRGTSNVYTIAFLGGLAVGALVGVSLPRYTPYSQITEFFTNPETSAMAKMIGFGVGGIVGGCFGHLVGNIGDYFSRRSKEKEENDKIKNLIPKALTAEGIRARHKKKK
ncbi:MAG: hypothetical protein Q8L27_01015 [archaeon]|nr:hypothetical protein [archaeon]